MAARATGRTGRTGVLGRLTLGCVWPLSGRLVRGPALELARSATAGRLLRRPRRLEPARRAAAHAVPLAADADAVIKRAAAAAATLAAALAAAALAVDAFVGTERAHTKRRRRGRAQ
eukprot:5072909-Prymnesium_polylepis.1